MHWESIPSNDVNSHMFDIHKTYFIIVNNAFSELFLLFLHK